MLRSYIEKTSDLGIFKAVETPTSKGYLLDINSANRYCIHTLYFK
jgi:hypothetical protein